MSELTIKEIDFILESLKWGKLRFKEKFSDYIKPIIEINENKMLNSQYKRLQEKENEYAEVILKLNEIKRRKLNETKD